LIANPAAGFAEPVQINQECMFAGVEALAEPCQPTQGYTFVGVESELVGTAVDSQAVGRSAPKRDRKIAVQEQSSI
jgi:hypothetical protein